MKKMFFVGLLFIAGTAYAGIEKEAFIGPLSSTQTTITIVAPGANKANCLEYVTMQSTGSYTFLILDGGTTTYQVAVTTTTLDHRTPPFELCGTANTVTLIKYVRPAGSEVPTINYKGYIRR